MNSYVGKIYLKCNPLSSLNCRAQNGGGNEYNVNKFCLTFLKFSFYSASNVDIQYLQKYIN